MKLFKIETLDRGVMCTPAWFSIIIRENPFYRRGWSIRFIIPWYKNDWHYSPDKDEWKWCRLYQSIFFFGSGFIGQRWFLGWGRAEDLGI